MNDEEIVQWVRSLCGENARVLVFDGSDAADAALSQQDLSADELEMPLALRVLDLRGCHDLDACLCLANGFAGYAMIVAERWAGNSICIDALATLGFGPTDGLAGLFGLADPLLAGRRWFAESKWVALNFAFVALDPDRLDLPSAIGAARLARGADRVAEAARYWKRAAALDRSLGEAYLGLADAARLAGSPEEEYIWLVEASRTGAPDEETIERIRGLEARLDGSPYAEARQALLGLRRSESKLGSPARILVVTNLFPPQEMGGYGRKIWEFVRELKRRGHDLRILAADQPELSKWANEEEKEIDACVDRSLQLYGDWSTGSAELCVSEDRILPVMNANRRRIESELEAFAPDFCLLGNLDFIGHMMLGPLEKRKVPVVHCLGNALPGWPDDYPVSETHYRPGPASRHLADKMKAAGYALRHEAVLYPGARLEHFYREALPALDVPRIAYAGIIMPYKGPQTLLEALAMLKSAGLEFRAVFAGIETDPNFVEGMKKAAKEMEIADWVEFPGYLDRDGLARLFDRSNILVFPSIVEEAFGISHVEAMAAGLATITTGTGGASEIVRDDVDGLVFEKESALMLAQKIAGLVAEPEKWERLCRAGRERSKRFAVASTVDRIEELFAEMSAGEIGYER